MTKTLISWILFLIAFSANADETKGKSQLVGSWSCSSFTLKDAHFTVNGSGIVRFSASGKMISELDYNYIFGEDQKLIIKFELIGSWKSTREGIVDSITEVKIKDIDTSLQMSNEKLEELVKSNLVLNKETPSQISFSSAESFTWKTNSSEEDVVCKSIK